jgi:hypothetical protein
MANVKCMSHATMMEGRKMLQFWVELLPLFVVRWMARDLPSRHIAGRTVTVPRPGVMIQVNEFNKENKCVNSPAFSVF